MVANLSLLIADKFSEVSDSTQTTDEALKALAEAVLTQQNVGRVATQELASLQTINEELTVKLESLRLERQRLLDENKALR